jgi:hypothetical protein
LSRGLYYSLCSNDKSDIGTGLSLVMVR